MWNTPESGAQPHVLLLAAETWPVGARLGLAMRAVGFRVSIWCPPGHPLLVTGAVDRQHSYRTFESLDSLEAAVIAAHPHLIVPCDDLAALRLHQLAERAMGQPRLEPVLAIIEQSLGPLAGLNGLTERPYVLAAAEAAGVAVPANARIASSADMQAWFGANGFPAYLKADGTSGGIGVLPVHNHEEAEAAFRALDAPPRILRVLKRLFVDRDTTLIAPLLRRQPPLISAQHAIAGADVNSAIFCWQGRVLASVSAQVLATRYERGPSTVIRRIQNAAMDRAAEVLASRLKLSGFYGLDFILDDQTGTPWLIEMNSRATQTAHLAFGPGHDLTAAAFAAVTGVPEHPRPVVTTEATIVLFPQEWQCNPASPWFQNAYHDVPWDVPKLVRLYISQRPGWRQWLTRRHWLERRRQKTRLDASTPSETAPRLP